VSVVGVVLFLFLWGCPFWVVLSFGHRNNSNNNNKKKKKNGCRFVWILVESLHAADFFDVPVVVLADGNVSFTLTPVVDNVTATYNASAFTAAATTLFGSVAEAPPLSSVVWDAFESVLANMSMPPQTWGVVQRGHNAEIQLQLTPNTDNMTLYQSFGPLLLHGRSPKYIQDRRRTLRLAFAFPTPAVGYTLAAAGNVSRYAAVFCFFVI
jgi:hypothetical protein